MKLTLFSDAWWIICTGGHTDNNLPIIYGFMAQCIRDVDKNERCLFIVL